MKKYLVPIFIIVFVITLGYFMRSSLMAKQTAVSDAAVSTGGTSTSQMTLFSASADYSSSVQIFPGDLSEKAKMYLENFDLKKEISSNGATQITLTPKSGAGDPQNYTVKSGESLYFVEKFPQDDSADTDKNIKDDYGVIVDGSGYIVSR